MDENRDEMPIVALGEELAADMAEGAAPIKAPETAAPADDTAGEESKAEGPYVYKRSGGAAPPKPQKPPKTQEELEYEAAKKAHFKTYVWKPVFAPIVALVAICLITSLLLGLTNELTLPLIEANAAAEAEDARRTLLPEADHFTQMPLDGLPDNVTAVYKADNGAGWVFETYGRGYGGKVPATVAFDANGDIAGVSFPANNETPGLGQKLVSDPAFAAQFGGLPAQNISLGDIDKIASATISSSAALTAVNTAIEAYGIETGGAAAAPQSPEEVRAALLPGESLTPITVGAPNVQPTAYVSDAGNYIIYGEKPPGEHSDKPVVAAVAMSPDGTILNLWIDTSGENEAYGATLATNKKFLDSFIGEQAPVQVDAVADVTNSSKSVMEAVNAALDALPQAKEAG